MSSGCGRRWNESRVSSVLAVVVAAFTSPRFIGAARKRRLQCLAASTQNRRPFPPDVSTFVSRQHHRFERHAICRSSRGGAHRMPDRSAAEHESTVSSPGIGQQLVHLSGVNATRCHHDMTPARSGASPGREDASRRRSNGLIGSRSFGSEALHRVPDRLPACRDVMVPAVQNDPHPRKPHPLGR